MQEELGTRAPPCTHVCKVHQELLTREACVGWEPSLSQLYVYVQKGPGHMHVQGRSRSIEVGLAL